ncbi:hypothetical protein F0L17_26635 [Streptomyces sp. TRM43335]|uniref:4Fe-4S Wbl-type domain-containing protein n=1 Tax=Streptomyces taklimakanensis TaxID=2569853 RepID=A0A6G2BK11_9ACTN|nr:hypothetical protein [Streptomyces taklimakanensis]MTE22608.1 hypothetical protein [Streptomyces taklimakanensis]
MTALHRIRSTRLLAAAGTAPDRREPPRAACSGMWEVYDAARYRTGTAADRAAARAVALRTCAACPLLDGCAHAVRPRRAER